MPSERFLQGSWHFIWYHTLHFASSTYREFGILSGTESAEKFAATKWMNGPKLKLEQRFPLMRSRVGTTVDLYGDVLCSRHSVVGPDRCTVLDNEASHEHYFRTLQFVTSTHVVFFIHRGIHQAAKTVPIGKMSCSNGSIVFFLVFARQGPCRGYRARRSNSTYCELDHCMAAFRSCVCAC